MTVGLSTSPNQYIGDGILDTYPYDFKIFAETDIEVYVDEVLLTGGYSLTGIGNGTGGNVVFDNEHIPGNQVSIVFSRNLPITQEIHYIEGDKFLADTHETGLDREVMLIQRLYEGFKKTIRLPMYSLIEDIYLTPEANKYLKWNSEGDGIEGADLGEIFPGIGDMLRSVYDTDSNGIVDDSERLGGSLPSAFSLTTHNHSGVYSPLIHDHIQANITGLTISDSPVFVTAKLSGLTDGYLPYHISDMVGLGNSPIFTDGINIGFKTSSPGSDLDIAGTSSLGAELRLRQKTSGSTYIGLKAPDIIEDSITYLLPLNGSNGQVWSLIDALTGETGWITPASGGAETFLALTDVPSSYTGEGTKFVRVNEGESALEFVDAPGGVGGSGAVNRVSIWSDASILSSDPAFTFITPTLTLSNSVAGGKTSLATRNTDGGTGSYNQINIGNNTAADEFRLRINSSGYTTYPGYSYIWSKADNPMQFGVNNKKTLQIYPGNMMLYNAAGDGYADLTLHPETGDLYISTNGASLTLVPSVHALGGLIIFPTQHLSFWDPLQTHYTRFVAQTQSANISYTLPDAIVTNGFLKTDGSGNLSWDTPADFGDMLKAIYDPDINGIFAVAQGGTNKSSWTRYAIPYLSGPTTFGEIAIGTSGKFLKSLGTNYMWDIPTALAGGSNRQLQYNNSGVLGGISIIVYASLYGVSSSASGPNNKTYLANAIAALPTNGGIVELPVGEISIGGTGDTIGVTIGDGGGIGPSTRNGVWLRGQGTGKSNWYMGSYGGATILKWTGNSGGTIIKINGAVQGCKVSDLTLNGNTSASTLLEVNYGAEFQADNILGYKWQGGFAIKVQTVGSWGGGTLNQTWNHIYLSDPSGLSAHGITIAPNGSGNVSEVRFHSLLIDLPNSTLQIPIQLGYCDHITFTGVDSFTPTNGITVEVRPVPGYESYPTNITFLGSPLVGAIKYNSTDQVWSSNYPALIFLPYYTVDGQPLPPTGFGGSTLPAGMVQGMTDQMYFFQNMFIRKDVPAIDLKTKNGSIYWDIVNNASASLDLGLSIQKNGIEYMKIDPHGDSNNPMYLYVGGSLKHITIDGSGFLKGV
jgi:hypothetical protein